MRRIIDGYGLENQQFKPALAQLLAALKRDPKRFPKKSGSLDAARSAKLRFRGAAWRAVFTLDEERRVVTILSLAPHDRAYAEAERRLG